MERDRDVWRGWRSGVIVYDMVGDSGELWFGGLKGVSCGWCCDCPDLGFQIEFVISFDYGDLPERFGMVVVRLSEGKIAMRRGSQNYPVSVLLVENGRT